MPHNEDTYTGRPNLIVYTTPLEIRTDTSLIRTLSSVPSVFTTIHCPYIYSPTALEDSVYPEVRGHKRASGGDQEYCRHCSGLQVQH